MNRLKPSKNHKRISVLATFLHLDQQGNDIMKGIRTWCTHYGYVFHTVPTRQLTFQGAAQQSLAIAIGGDGTFLRTSHFLDESTPLLGVNMDPPKKYGFYTRASLHDLHKKLELISNGKANIRQMTRLQARINGKSVPEPILNEVFIGSVKPHRSLRLQLSVKGKTEFQCNSGVLVGTATGSYGWMHSAGILSLPLFSKRFAFVVREPIASRLFQATLRKGILRQDEQLNIKMLSSDAYLVVDGVGKEYLLPPASRITVDAHGQPLRFVDFGDT
ncbi:NAD(+)/NADH kinase [Candidatus Woesearchaeota archaeon]|nr:NAD(+)/NADH kinase [Candidatus Woesearchaeota archaeon]